MLYSRQFIESCREHKPTTGTAKEASLDATNAIPSGGMMKFDITLFGEVVVPNAVCSYVWRNKEDA
jgi:hypothetical protein